MTLKRQILLSVSGVVGMLLLGLLILALVQPRQALVDVATDRAQHWADLLVPVVALAPDPGPQLRTALEDQLVTAVAVRGPNGTLRYQREIELPWWVEVLGLPTVTANASDGLNHVTITARPALSWFWGWVGQLLALWLLVALVAYALALGVLSLILRPLRLLRGQAEAIARREFTPLEELPAAAELRAVAEAQNRMTGKLRELFEEQLELAENLHRESQLDSVTGLSNRRDFDARLDAFIRSEQGGSPGAVLLLQLAHFNDYNRSAGWELGDQCLQEVADVLREALADIPGAVIARPAGADFIAFLPHVSLDEVAARAEPLFQRLVQLPPAMEGVVRVHLGVVYSTAVTLDNQLLSQADFALSQAQHHGVNGWHLHQVSGEEAPELPVRSAREWRHFLHDTLDQRRVLLHYQPVRDPQRQLLYNEVLLRLRDDEHLLPAGLFLPMAERFNLALDFDRLTLQQLKTLSLDYGSDYRFSVNCSARAAQDPEFIDWLLGFLQEYPRFARQLLVEVPEFTVGLAPSPLRLLASRLQELGTGLTLDHFGAGGTPFGYLHSLPLAAVKLDRSLVRGIAHSADTQFYVRSLGDIVRPLGIKLLVEGVEEDADWRCLCELGIDGGQGNLLGRPSPDIPTS